MTMAEKDDYSMCKLKIINDIYQVLLTVRAEILQIGLELGLELRVFGLFLP